jgi:uncharacterized protein (DUF2147 family)
MSLHVWGRCEVSAFEASIVKRTVILCLAFFCLAISAFASSQKPGIIGNWVRQDGEIRIQIAPCGNSLCAVNTWVSDPSGDEKLGDTLEMTLQVKSPTMLSGRAHDERRNMTYSIDIIVGPSSMQTQGCMLFGMLCKRAQWKRLQ